MWLCPCHYPITNQPLTITSLFFIYVQYCHFEIHQWNHRICKHFRLFKLSKILLRYIKADVVTIIPSSVWQNPHRHGDACNQTVLLFTCLWQLDCFWFLAITNRSLCIAAVEFSINENKSSRLHTSKRGLLPLTLIYWTRPLTKCRRYKAK